MKLSLFTYGAMGVLFALASCQSPVISLSSGSGHVTVSVGSGKRTLVADVASQVTKYEVELSKDGAVSLSASFDPADAAGVSFDAVAGVWDVNVVAFAGSAVVGQGSLENQTVESGVDTDLSVALVTSQTGTGSILHAFSVPASDVDSVTAHLSTLAGTTAGSFASPVLTVSGGVASGTLEMGSVASGNYRLTIEFRKGSNVVKTMVEAVNVYDHLVTNRWVGAAGQLKAVRVFAVGDFTSFPGTLTGPSTMVAQAFSNTDTATSLVAMATDASGFTYAVLHKASDAFDLTVGSKSIPTSRTSALVKFDSAGNALWVSPIAGLEISTRDISIVADDAGNVFLAGGLVPTNELVLCDVSDTPVVTKPALASGDYTAFVAKYNSAGTPLWGVRNTNSDGSYSLFNALTLSGTGSNQRIIVAGETGTGSYQFDTLTVQGIAADGPVVAVFDADGHGIWAATMDKINGSSSPSEPLYFYLNGVGVDGQGNITVSGITGLDQSPGVPADGDTFELVDPQGQKPLIITNKGAARNQVLVRYSPEGVPLWSKVFGSTVTLRSTSGNLAVDTFGRSFWTGLAYNGELDLGAGVSQTFGSTKTVVVAGFDVDGTALWLKSAGSTDMFDNKLSLAVDQQGGVYLAGSVQVTAALASTPLDLGDSVTITPAKASNSAAVEAPILVKYSSDTGATLWARSSTNLVDNSRLLCLSVRGSLLAVGGIVTDTYGVDFGDSQSAAGLKPGDLSAVMVLYQDVY